MAGAVGFEVFPGSFGLLAPLVALLVVWGRSRDARRMVDPIVRKFVLGNAEERIEVLGPHLRTLRTHARSVWDDDAMALREAEKRARKLKKEGWVEVEGGVPWRIWDPNAKVVDVLTANEGKHHKPVFQQGAVPWHWWTSYTNSHEEHLFTSDEGTRAVEVRMHFPTAYSPNGNVRQPIDAAVRAQTIEALTAIRDEALVVDGVRAFPLEPTREGGFDTLWVLGPLRNLKVAHPSIERSVSLAFPGWRHELREEDGVAVAMARCDFLRYTHLDRKPAPAFRARFDCRPGVKSDKKLLVYKPGLLGLLKTLAKAKPGGFLEIENFRGELARFEVEDGALRGFASGSPEVVNEAVERFLRP